MPSCPDSFDAAPSTPRPTGTPARSMSRTGSDARGEARVRRRAVRDARAGGGISLDRGLVEVHAVRHPHVAAEPADRLEVLRGRHAEPLEAVGVLLHGLGGVGVQAHAERAREHGRFAQQVGGHRERRARRDRHAHERVERRVVIALDGFGGRAERGIRRLHGEVRGESALRGAEVHRAAGRVQAHADTLRRLDDRAHDVTRALREDVVVVAHGGAPGAGEHGHPARGADARQPGVDLRPERVERREPVEQDRVLRVAAGEPLVQVVVRVDQARA